MIDFYKDREKGTIDPKLFSDVAENWSKTIHQSGENRINKRTQLRKFYDEVVRFNGLAKADPTEWDNIAPYVNMLIAKAVYAQGRNLVTKDFVEMLKVCVAQVKDGRDLDVFANFFEAFIGFYRQYE